MELQKDIFTTVKDILGYGDESIEPQHDRANEEFEEMYDSEVISALESGNYNRAESLLEPMRTDFEEAVQDYIGQKIATASIELEYFSDMVIAAEELVDGSDTEIADMNENSDRISNKLEVKPSIKLASKYISNLNSLETTETMRNVFKSFYHAIDAAEHIQDREDVEFSRYDADSVKEFSRQKAEELRELDRNMGLDFMITEFNDLADDYNKL